MAAFSNARGITNVPGAIKHIKPPAAMGVSAIVINSQDTGFFQNDTSTYATMISSDISEVSKVGPKSQWGAYRRDDDRPDQKKPRCFHCWMLSVVIGVYRLWSCWYLLRIGNSPCSSHVHIFASLFSSLNCSKVCLSLWWPRRETSRSCRADATRCRRKSPLRG